MDHIFLFITLLGILYLAALFLVFENPEKAKLRFRQRFNPEKIQQIFDNKMMQAAFINAGIQVPVRNINKLRYFGIMGWLTISYLSHVIRGEPITLNPVFMALGLIYVTSPIPFAPLGWFLYRFRKRKEILRDSEVLSFLRIYENNRMRKAGYIQFWAFCRQVAPNFRFIQKDLLLLSQMVVDENLEIGLDWFVTQFPEKHPFINDIRTILLTTEDLDHQAAVLYLKDQNKSISNISGDQYAKRWGYITDIATIFNTLPSAATFVMLICLVISYVYLIKSNSGLGG